MSIKSEQKSIYQKKQKNKDRFNLFDMNVAGASSSVSTMTQNNYADNEYITLLTDPNYLPKQTKFIK